MSSVGVERSGVSFVRLLDLQTTNQQAYQCESSEHYLTGTASIAATSLLPMFRQSSRWRRPANHLSPFECLRVESESCEQQTEQYLEWRRLPTSGNEQHQTAASCEACGVRQDHDSARSPVSADVCLPERCDCPWRPVSVNGRNMMGLEHSNAHLESTQACRGNTSSTGANSSGSGRTDGNKAVRLKRVSSMLQRLSSQVGLGEHSPKRTASSKNERYCRSRSYSIDAKLVPDSLRRTAGIRNVRAQSDAGAEGLVVVSGENDEAGFSYGVTSSSKGPARCIVRSVAAGSWVEKLDVQAGDEIVSVNGVSLENVKDVDALKCLVRQARQKADGRPTLVIRTNPEPGTAFAKHTNDEHRLSLPILQSNNSAWRANGSRQSSLSSGSDSVDAEHLATGVSVVNVLSRSPTHAESETSHSLAAAVSCDSELSFRSSQSDIEVSTDPLEIGLRRGSRESRQCEGEGTCMAYSGERQGHVRAHFGIDDSYVSSAATRGSLLQLRDNAWESSSSREDFLEKFAIALGHALGLPLLAERAFGVVFEDEENLSPETVYQAGRTAVGLLRSVSIDSIHEPEIFAPVESLSVEAVDDAKVTKETRGMSGLLVACVLDGEHVGEPENEVYCSLDVSSRAGGSTSSACVDANGDVSWGDDLHILITGCCFLTVSCFVRARLHSDQDLLCAQAVLPLESLFIGGPVRRIAVKLIPQGMVKMKLMYMQKSAMLRRQISLANCGAFGIALELVVQRERTEVPILIQKCIGEIEKRGLSTKGLYRRSGATKKKNELRRAFESNSKAVNISEEHVLDIRVIADLIKEYLRMLPEPLLTQRLYNDLIGTVQQNNNGTETVDKERLFALLETLPAPNFKTCQMLFRHFQRVLENSSKNMMTTESLSICFGPVLMSPSIRSEDSVLERKKALAYKAAKEFKAPAAVIQVLLERRWPNIKRDSSS